MIALFENSCRVIFRFSTVLVDFYDNITPIYYFYYCFWYQSTKQIMEGILNYLPTVMFCGTPCISVQCRLLLMTLNLSNSKDTVKFKQREFVNKIFS